MESIRVALATDDGKILAFRATAIMRETLAVKALSRSINNFHVYRPEKPLYLLRLPGRDVPFLRAKVDTQKVDPLPQALVFFPVAAALNLL